MNNNNDAGNRIVANRVYQILNIFRELDPDMPMGEAVAFTMIALGETKEGGGLTVTELGQRGGVALASASRYMKSLGSKNRHGGLGHEVVFDVRDPFDERRKIIRLTPKGNQMFQKFKNVVGD